jgi:hypothetical protein
VLKRFIAIYISFIPLISFGQTTKLIEELKSHKLPIFEIILNTQDQITSKEEYTTATFIIHTINNGKYSSETIQTEIKGRGNSSWNWPKKPFRLKLASKKKLLGMPSSRHWALLANFADKTLLRNKLASSVSKYFGLKYGPRSEMVELVMNGWHWGTYEVTEVPKIETDRIDITSIKSTNGVVSGGVIFELDERRGEQYNFQTSIANQVFTVKDPDDLNTKVPEIAQAHLDYCINILQTAENALYSDNFKDVTTGYQKYFNTQSVIDWYLTEELFKNIDVGRYSVYAYIDTKNNNKITFGPTWDFDLSSGVLEDYSTLRVITENAWISRFYQDENFRQLIKNRWTAKRNDLLYFINNRLNTDSRNIFVGQQKNFNFWNNFYDVITSEYPSFHQESNFENDIFYLKSWLRKRVEFLDKQFSDNQMHVKPIAKDTSINIIEDEIASTNMTAEFTPSTNKKYFIAKSPLNGVIKNLNEITGTFEYVPDSNYNGIDTIHYSFFDGVTNSDTAIIRVNITPIEDPPVTISGADKTDEDVLLNRDAANGLVLYSSDAESDKLSFSLVSTTKNGILDLSSNGAFIYTPNKDYFGTDTFYFKAYDGQLYSNSSPFVIKINAVNDPPVTISGADKTNEDILLNRDTTNGLVSLGSDIENDKLSYSIASTTKNGTLDLSSNGAFIYTPNKDYFGTDTFYFKAYDGQLYSNSSPFVIKINAVNDPPVISDLISFYQIFRNQENTIDFTKYISDVDDPIDNLLLKEIMMNTKGTSSIMNNRTLTYTPDRNYIGLDSIAISVSDGKSISIPKTIIIRILNDYSRLENNNIKVYPNPSNGHFIIKDLLIDRINLYDMNGNRIVNFNYNIIGSSTEVKINNLTTGVYLIQLSYKNKLIGFKNIIIIR